MSQWQASNASARCPELTAIPTLASPTGTTPTRCTIATRSSGHCRRAWRASSRISRTAMLANASYSSRVTRRPAFSLRVVPRNSTDAPAPGSPTAARRRAGSIRASVISNSSATAHRWEERDLVAVGQHVVRLDVALVHGDPYARARDGGMCPRQRLPERAGGGARLHRPFLAGAELLAQRSEEPELDLRHGSAPHQLHHVPEHREQQPLHGEIDGLGGARKRDDHGPGCDARHRAREHRGRTDVGVRQRAEELAETVETFVEQPD